MNLTPDDIKTLLHDSDTQRRELLEQCRSGDRRAFNRFVQQYQDAVYGHVVRMAGKTEALNVTRDVFAAAYASFEKLPDFASVESWLFHLAEQRIQPALQESKAQQSIDTEHPESADDLDDLLVAYLDGELEETDIRRVEQRLEDDPAYRRELEQLQQVDDMMGFLNPVSAPVELRVLVNAKLDEKSWWGKILEAIEVFRHGIPEQRWLKNAHIAYALGSVVVILFGAWLYQFQQLQIQRITIQELQYEVSRSGNQTGDPSESATTFLLLTGTLNPKELSLDDTRSLTKLTSTLTADIEPFFISGNIESVTALVEERIAPHYWQQRHEEDLSTEGFAVSKIVINVPESALLPLSQEFVSPEQLLSEPDKPMNLAPIPITFFIIDRLS